MRFDPEMVGSLQDLARQLAVESKKNLSWADVVRHQLAKLLAIAKQSNSEKESV